MSTIRPIPSPTIRVIDENGLMTQVWYEYFRTRELIGTAKLADVSDTAPANGEVLVFNSTTGKWTPGAN